MHKYLIENYRNIIIYCNSQKEGKAIAHFNISNLDQLRAICDVAEELSGFISRKHLLLHQLVEETLDGSLTALDRGAISATMTEDDATKPVGPPGPAFGDTASGAMLSATRL